MILLSIRDREIRTPRDLNRATSVKLVNRDIPIPSVANRVYVFKRLGVLGRGRDAPNPTGEIGGYTSRGGIS